MMMTDMFILPQNRGSSYEEYVVKEGKQTVESPDKKSMVSLTVNQISQITENTAQPECTPPME
jgi:hypothetical protein